MPMRPKRTNLGAGTHGPGRRRARRGSNSIANGIVSCAAALRHPRRWAPGALTHPRRRCLLQHPQELVPSAAAAREGIRPG
uniref:Uncharacterized protein n=1 Tax=Setaria viridis TaxID=4556 RepID=A0A4U6T7X3_SETVI|nr:hypothetical protein SEVIR_9G526701v2 [Setaria viridis]TKV97939.1 hypothetical protein SEVIR_9G526701v2 [Setaria viridis]